ncbi:hypothetical protein D3C78_1829430 [compost metagenome]
MSKEPYPENLSFEEVLASVVGGNLVQRVKPVHQVIQEAEAKRTDSERLVLKPNPEYLVDVHV